MYPESHSRWCSDGKQSPSEATDGCVREARDVPFWPGMSAEIKDSMPLMQYMQSLPDKPK